MKFSLLLFAGVLAIPADFGPTATASPRAFSPQELVANVQSIHQALASSWIPMKSTDTDALIAILTTKSEEQMSEVAAAYEGSYGVTLARVITKKTSGQFRKILLDLTQPIASVDATIVYESIHRLFGNDQNSLISTLVGRSNAEIIAIEAAYQTIYKRDIVQDIQAHLGGSLRPFLVSILQAQRDELGTIQGVEQDVASIYMAGRDKWLGVDRDTFFEIFNMRSYEHLRLVFDAYPVRYANGSIEADISYKFNGAMQRALLATMESVVNRTAFLASQLEASMTGFGTSTNELRHLVVRNRSPIVMEQIKAEYATMYAMSNATLYERIQKDVSGNFGKVLLALVGN